MTEKPFQFSSQTETRTSKSKKLDILEYSENKDPLTAIIESKQFEKRVEKMTRRVLQLEAESGFVVFVRNNTLLFGSVVDGTRFARDVQDLFIGMKHNEASVIHESYYDYDIHYNALGGAIPREIAFFHIHPGGGGFSSTDIENFENAKYNEAKGMKESIKDYGVELYSKQDLQHSHAYGLLSPKYSISSGGKSLIKNLNFFMLSGQPTSTKYQGIDIESVPIKQQAKLFEECGFKVMYRELPCNRGKIDFSLLHSNLV